MSLTFEEEKEIIQRQVSAAREIAEFHRKNILLKHECEMAQIRLRMANENKLMLLKTQLIEESKRR